MSQYLAIVEGGHLILFITNYDNTITTIRPGIKSCAILSINYVNHLMCVKTIESMIYNFRDGNFIECPHLLDATPRCAYQIVDEYIISSSDVGITICDLSGVKVNFIKGVKHFNAQGFNIYYIRGAFEIMQYNIKSNTYTLIYTSNGVSSNLSTDALYLYFRENNFKRICHKTMSIEIIKAEDNYFNDSTAIVSVDYNSIHNHIQYNITHYNNKPIDKISILANSLILIHENNVLVRGWHEIIESTQKKYTLTKWYAGDYYSIYHINTTVGTKTKAALHGDHAD